MLAYIIGLALIMIFLYGAVRLHLSFGLHHVTKAEDMAETSEG